MTRFSVDVGQLYQNCEKINCTQITMKWSFWLFLDSKALGCLISESVDVPIFSVHGQVTGDGHHLGAVQAQLGQPTQIDHSPKCPWSITQHRYTW